MFCSDNYRALPGNLAKKTVNTFLGCSIIPNRKFTRVKIVLFHATITTFSKGR